MTSYLTLRAKIAELEKQAEALRKDELKTVIGQIRKAVAEFGLTAADLGLNGSGKARKARAAAAPRPRGRRSVGVAKYRHPDTGATWTGHGRPPTWIVEASDREAYRIGAGASSSAKAGAKKKPGRPAKAAAKPAAKGRKTAAAKPAGKKTAAAKKATAKRAGPGRKRTAAAKAAPAQADAGAASV
jgi:DNA-binding protein H-NS